MKKIITKGIEVAVIKREKDDYISLTDMARYKGPETGIIIAHWLSTRFTVEFLGIWEQLHNPDFNITEFSYIKSESGGRGWVLSVSKWRAKTNGIGLMAKTGRHGSGTFAHKDIAFEFASWISPEFKLYLIKEFQRLKEDENERLALDWNAKRSLTKINYRIHTDAVAKYLLPKKLSNTQIDTVFASEADVLNMALFGMTAKQWRDKKLKKEGNIRDYADVVQLICLANLETLNAEFIRQGIDQKKRLITLNEIAISQLKLLAENASVKKLQ
jgi:hypothetical protein